MTLQVASFYRFVELAPRALAHLQQTLLQVGRAAGVKGTVLLAPEGINATICAPQAGVDALLACLNGDPRLAGLELRTSWSPRQPFHRLKVRCKAEIVTMGCPAVNPARTVGTYVAPQQWDQLIEDPGTLVIDTRNHYEVALGSFEGAIDPATRCFREFPDWVERRLAPLVAERQPQRLALFCTGGIRCEKATAYLLQQGFGAVHHLEGGILRYLEQVPEAQSSWRGECFVFDQRVALNHRLEPGSHGLCHACRMPLSPADRSLPSYREGVSCHHCHTHHSAADRRRFEERQKQMAIARARGDDHIGRHFPPAPLPGTGAGT